MLLLLLLLLHALPLGLLAVVDESLCAQLLPWPSQPQRGAAEGACPYTKAYVELAGPLAGPQVYVLGEGHEEDFWSPAFAATAVGC